MFLTLPLAIILCAISPSNAFVVPRQGLINCHRQRSWRSTATVDSIEDASSFLQQWDTSTNPDQVKSDTTTATSTPSAPPFDTDAAAARPKLADAVRLLNDAATAERNQDSTQGRCMLGICASTIEEGVGALKSWVTNLNLPRGLLHGMDKDGVPLEFEGGVYIKYNSGGVYTFEGIRKSGLGFDALWKPGDALLESYDGTYRGVYFQVELLDGEFRQYLVPMDLFEQE